MWPAAGRRKVTSVEKMKRDSIFILGGLENKLGVTTEDIEKETNPDKVEDTYMKLGGRLIIEDIIRSVEK